MRIAIIGAGAIGSAVAAAVARAGADVTLVARGRRLAMLPTAPVRIISDSAAWEQAVPACAVDELVGPLDLAICCVKTPDLPSALSTIRGKLAPHGVVLTLQNGVEAHEQAAAVLPDAAIVAGRLHGFFELEGSTVRHVGVAPTILLGCTHGAADQAEALVLRALAGSGIAAVASPDIVRALWEKFMLAASLGSVAAALGVSAGMVCNTSEHVALLRAAMKEVAAVAEASGIGLADADIDASLDFVRSFPAHVTTSLQRDLERGHKSEYDALTEAVPRIARRHGLTLYVFPMLAKQIKMRCVTLDAD